MFIAIEGADGAGKSTLAAGIAGRLRESGRVVVEVREPGGTETAEAIRSLVLDPAVDASDRSELLLYLAARADLVSKVIQPALVRGDVVVSDRFELSTLAYQGAGRGIPLDEIGAANHAATGGVSPGVTIVIDVTRELGEERRASAGRAPDRIERESDGLHDRVARFFREADGPGIIHIDGRMGATTVLDTAWRAIADCLGDGAGE